MYNRLPPDLIRLIYQFDPTFSQMYSKILQQLKCKYYYDFYYDGTVERYAFNKRGKLHGKYVIWNIWEHTFRVHSSKNYKNGILHGVCKEYYYNGSLRKQENYNNGKMVSPVVKTYFDNGILRHEAEYQRIVSLYKTRIIPWQQVSKKRFLPLLCG
jgi:antitoxin component YwqK of YwqJK toxin-antitoxin module